MAPKTGTKKNGVPSHILYQVDGNYRQGLGGGSVDWVMRDRLVLSHLAPPARHYGFNILLAHAKIHLTWHLGRQCDGFNGYPEKDNMSQYALEIGTSWKFTDLGGQEVELKDDRIV
jgi:hypothetical protein